jgi:peroxiredoxin
MPYFWVILRISLLYTRAHGIFREQDGFSERVNIIIDRSQKIAFVKVYPLGKLPDIEEVVDKLKTLP